LYDSAFIIKNQIDAFLLYKKFTKFRYKKTIRMKHFLILFV